MGKGGEERGGDNLLDSIISVYSAILSNQLDNQKRRKLR